jgi:hypothetical protein
MPMKTHIVDREYDKFEEVAGLTSVRVSGSNFSGEFRTSGLTVGGRVTNVAISDSAWTALPATALPNRNAVGIQNFSGVEIKLNYDNSVPGYDGVIMRDGDQRQYDITDDILIYAKSSSGAATIIVEEIA